MVSYNPLWHTLINKGMKKLELCRDVGISTSTLAKLGKNEFVALKVLNDICLKLDCKIEDVVEILSESEVVGSHE